MKINQFSKSNPPDRNELEKLGGLLLESLSLFTGSKLDYFEIHIVDKESFVGTFKGSSNFLNVVNIDIEGVILYHLTNDAPSINCELLFFSDNSRLGLMSQKGESYFILNFNKNQQWEKSTWMRDDVIEWLNIDKPRRTKYDSLKFSYD